MPTVKCSECGTVVGGTIVGLMCGACALKKAKALFEEQKKGHGTTSRP